VPHTAMASAMSAARSRSNGSSRIHVLLVYVFHALVPMVKAIPLPFGGFVSALHEEEHPKADASLVLYLAIAIALVLAGGVFAGLTIA
jgi:metal transporter CNNM